MAVNKTDLQEFRDKKVQERETLTAEKDTARQAVEQKVTEFRKTLVNGLDLEFRSQEDRLDGAIDAIDQLIGQTPDDVIPKEDL
ncbi:MAG: hypothetical protein A2Y16_05330 [Tenericutes bacterium GWF2_57_13]|nr:MAG: hypothetical protein A2Y16_05330 [Tenericutes bacterium GWF2_57_13]